MELRKTNPREAQSLPEMSAKLDPAILGVVTAVQGFAFPGPGIDAILYTLRFLRDNPDYREVLFPQPVNPVTKKDGINALIAPGLCCTCWHRNRYSGVHERSCAVSKALGNSSTVYEGDVSTWSHCGRLAVHGPHVHTVVVNEGAIPEVQCNGTRIYDE